MTEHRAWSRHRDGNSKLVNTRLNIETELPLLDELCIMYGISRSEILRKLVLEEIDRRDRKIEE